MIRAKKPFQKAILFFLFSIALGLLGGMVARIINSSDPLEVLFLISRDQTLTPGPFDPRIITITLPMMIQMMLLAIAAESDFSIIKSYVLIRQGNIRRWFWGNVCFLTGLSMVCSFGYHCGIALLCALTGRRIENMHIFLLVFGYCTVITGLITLLMALMANLLSYKTGQKSGMLFTLAFAGVSETLLFVLPQKLLKWNWMSHFLYRWHNANAKTMLYFSGGVPDDTGFQHSFLFSILFLLVCIAMETALGYIVLRRSDYL